jgi:hypothetical protein
MPYLPLPNGSYVEVPKGLSDEEALKLAKEQFPEGFEDYAKHKEKTGFLPALTSGFKTGAGSYAQGIGNTANLEGVNKYGTELKKAGEEGFQSTTDQDIEIAKRQGITSLLSTGLSKYITEPVGGMVGSLAGRYGVPIVANTAGRVAGPITGAAAFAATNFPAYLGEFVQAQKEEGQEADFGKALVPALVSTVVDSLGNEIVGGAMKGFALRTATQEAKLLAPKVLSGELGAQEAAAQISGKLSNVLKGTVEAAGAGAASGIANEAGRLYSIGKDVFSPEAYEQYIQAAKDMGMVAPFFGLLRMGEPRRAKKLIDEAGKKVESEKLATEKAAAEAEQKAYRESPEGIAEMAQQRTTLEQQIADLKAVLKDKTLPNEERLLGKEQIGDLYKQLNELKKQAGEVEEKPSTLEGRLEELRLKREQEAIAAQQQEQITKQKEIDDAAKAEELKQGAEVIKQNPDLAQAAHAELYKQVDDLETRLRDAAENGDVEKVKKIGEEYDTKLAALQRLQAHGKEAGISFEPLEKQLAVAKRQLANVTKKLADDKVLEPGKREEMAAAVDAAKARVTALQGYINDLNRRDVLRGEEKAELPNPKDYRDIPEEERIARLVGIKSDNTKYRQMFDTDTLTKVADDLDKNKLNKESANALGLPAGQTAWYFDKGPTKKVDTLRNHVAEALATIEEDAAFAKAHNLQIEPDARVGVLTNLYEKLNAIKPAEGEKAPTSAVSLLRSARGEQPYLQYVAKKAAAKRLKLEEPKLKEGYRPEHLERIRKEIADIENTLKIDEDQAKKAKKKNKKAGKFAVEIVQYKQLTKDEKARMLRRKARLEQDLEDAQMQGEWKATESLKIQAALEDVNLKIEDAKNNPKTKITKNGVANLLNLKKRLELDLAKAQQGEFGQLAGAPTPKGTVAGEQAVPAKRQETAISEIIDNIDSLRKGEFFGGTAGKEGLLESRSREVILRSIRNEIDTYAAGAITEINAGRRSNDLPDLTKQEENTVRTVVEVYLGTKAERATGYRATRLRAQEKGAAKLTPEDTAIAEAFEKAGFEGASELTKKQKQIMQAVGIDPTEFDGHSSTEIQALYNRVNFVQKQYDAASAGLEKAQVSGDIDAQKQFKARKNKLKTRLDEVKAKYDTATKAFVEGAEEETGVIRTGVKKEEADEILNRLKALKEAFGSKAYKYREAPAITATKMGETKDINVTPKEADTAKLLKEGEKKAARETGLGLPGKRVTTQVSTGTIYETDLVNADKTAKKLGNLFKKSNDQLKSENEREAARKVYEEALEKDGKRLEDLGFGDVKDEDSLTGMLLARAKLDDPKSAEYKRLTDSINKEQNSLREAAARITKAERFKKDIGESSIEKEEKAKALQAEQLEESKRTVERRKNRVTEKQRAAIKATVEKELAAARAKLIKKVPDNATAAQRKSINAANDKIRIERQTLEAQLDIINSGDFEALRTRGKIKEEASDRLYKKSAFEKEEDKKLRDVIEKDEKGVELTDAEEKIYADASSKGINAEGWLKGEAETTIKAIDEIKQKYLDEAATKKELIYYVDTLRKWRGIARKKGQRADFLYLDKQVKDVSKRLKTLQEEAAAPGLEKHAAREEAEYAASPAGKKTAKRIGFVKKRIAEKETKKAFASAAEMYEAEMLKARKAGFQSPEEMERYIRNASKSMDVEENTRDIRNLFDRDLSELDYDNYDDFGNVFRLGSKEKTTANLKETRRVADEFKAKLPEGVKFEYADTAVELPDYVRRQISKEEADIMKGAVLKDGTIVIVGDTHKTMLDFEKTLAHEAVGHYGLDRLLGLEGMVNLAKRIEAQPGGFVRMSRELGVLDDVMHAIREARKSDPNLTPEQEMMVGVREMIAHFEEQRLDSKNFLQKAQRFIKELIGQFKDWLRKNNLMELSKVTDADLLFVLKRSKEAMESRGGLRSGDIGMETAFRKAKPTDSNDPLMQLSNTLVAKPKTVTESFKGNLAAFNTQFVDRLAPIKEIWRRMGENVASSQMIYKLLSHGQRTNITSETLVNGARVFHTDPTTGEVTIRASGGPGMKQVLDELLKSTKGNPEALNQMFTAYAAAKRAKSVGFEKLVRDGEIDGNKITKDMLAAAERSGDADPAFVKAFEAYQKYNHGLIDSLASSGYISKDSAAKFKAKNYIPYYRARGGNVDLIIGNESPIRIGSLKDQPYLHELVGDNTKIQDFFRTSVQNTNMITEMALRNDATASVANTLKNLGIAEVHKGSGPAGPNVIRFKNDGKDYHAVIDTSKNAEFSDISSELLVKGLEGIPTQLPGIVRLLGIPANWLRKGVTRNPFYAYKQLVRDPISAWLTSGADFVPILSSLNEINKAVRGQSDTAKKLQEAGILGGEIYTGRAEDLNQIVTRLKSGKANLNGAMAFMDRVATEADASTRSVIYENYRKQGLSDMEAQIATMESMNFNTRGASPSMHWVNTMVPFFNSAIQGYNVMYKAFSGNMPYAKRLELQNKLIKRGSMIMGMSILYAIAQQDNEAYQNATPEQRYMNWFIPGMGKDGKESFRLPIPFEIGYIFKALPEAIVRMAYADDKAKEGLDAIKTVLQASNPIGIPTAIKAPLEIAMNRSVYSGAEVESKRLQGLRPNERYYDTTTEAAKLIGGNLGEVGNFFGISPAKIDYLAKGYFGGLYTTVATLVNPLIADIRGDKSTVKPDGTMADLPVFGQMFQPKDAGGLTMKAYDVLEKASQYSETYKHFQETGAEKEAEEYGKKYEQEINIGMGAASMKAKLDQLSGQIRKVKEQRLPSGMDSKQFAIQKREQLDELMQTRAELAKQFSAQIAETKRQSSR